MFAGTDGGYYGFDCIRIGRVEDPDDVDGFRERVGGAADGFDDLCVEA